MVVREIRSQLHFSANARFARCVAVGVAHRVTRCGAGGAPEEGADPGTTQVRPWEEKEVSIDAQHRMTRRQLLKYAQITVPILQAGVASKAKASRRGSGMNVILFITDQDRGIAHFPPDWERQNLPGLTRLKQNGLSFENAFTNACMCSRPVPL
jgi:hypothetical protein